MRVAQITGTTGSGTVVEVHEVISVGVLEQVLQLRNISGRAVEAPSWVRIGTVYNGTVFEQEETEVTPEPEVEIPAPPTLAEIESELDKIREGTVHAYIATWGELSKTELWPLLDKEIAASATKELYDITVDEYPAVVGFIQASGVANPTTEQIFDTLTGLRQHKSNHVKLLRQTELIRGILLYKYAQLDREDKVSWDSDTEWSVEQVKWD
jgi:hypothetical protein